MSRPRTRSQFRRALLTGAAGGLGSELSRLLAADGTALVLLDRDAGGLARVAAGLDTAGATVETHALDLADHDMLEARLREIADGEPLDLLVASAGIDRPMRTDALDWRQARDHFAVNVEANLVLLAVMVPRMLECGGGHIAAVASLAALAGTPYEAAYCASKAALATLVDSARSELGPRGITFTTVFPGFVDTAIMQGNAYRITSKATPADAAARIHDAVLARRPRLVFPRSKYVRIRLGNLLPVRVRDAMARRAMRRDWTPA